MVVLAAVVEVGSWNRRNQIWWWSDLEMGSNRIEWCHTDS
jgi:hypothetical protein